MTPLVFALPGNENLARFFSEAIGLERGHWTHRRFPDGEFYARVESSVRGNSVLLISSLNDPDEKILPLFFLASTLKDLGAKKVILLAPYLAYLRQDTCFQEGEGITSRYFAKLLSGVLDGLVTVDPHLHRYSSLAEIYSIPTRVVPAAPEISHWIAKHVPNPFLIGPDRESEQWVKQVANKVNAPYTVLEKTRKGDQEVAISFPSIDEWKARTPVIVDDIISSARTMIETVRHLKGEGFQAPICIGVHAVFAGNSYEDLLAAKVRTVVTCNTIPHPTNQIDLSRLLADRTKEILNQ